MKPKIKFHPVSHVASGDGEFDCLDGRAIYRLSLSSTPRQSCTKQESPKKARC